MNSINVVMANLLHPHIVIKTRLQTLQKGEGEDTYKGIIDCTRYVFEFITCCLIMSKLERLFFLMIGDLQAHHDAGGCISIPEGSNVSCTGHRASFWNCTGRLLPWSRGSGAGIGGIAPLGFLW